MAVNKSKAYIEIKGDSDHAVRALEKVGIKAKLVSKNFKGLEKRGSETTEKLVKGFNLVKVAVIGLATVIVGRLFQAYAGEEIQVKKAYALAESQGKITKEQTDLLIEQADALEKTGVVGGEVAKAFIAQAISFGLNYDQLKRLTPVILSSITSAKGLNATTQDGISMANILGYVMEGQTGRLKQMGIQFSEAEKGMISTGTQTEKLTALTEALTRNYGGLNEALTDTVGGSVAQMKNALEDLGKTFIELFAPAIKTTANALSGFAGLLKNQVTSALVVFSITLLSVSKVLKSNLVLGLLSSIKGFGGFVRGVNLGTLSMARFNLVLKRNPLGLIAFGIAGIITYLVAFRKSADETSDGLDKLANSGIGLGESFDNVESGVKETTKSIKELSVAVEENYNTTKKSLNDLFADELKKIDELKREKEKLDGPFSAGKKDEKRITKLNEEIALKEKLYNKNKKGLQNELDEEAIKDRLRYLNLTNFEKQIEDIKNEAIAKKEAIDEDLNYHIKAHDQKIKMTTELIVLEKQRSENQIVALTEEEIKYQALTRAVENYTKSVKKGSSFSKHLKGSSNRATAGVSILSAKFKGTGNADKFFNL